MQSAVLEIVRTFGVTFDHGDNFFDALRTFCEGDGVRQCYIPMFLAGLRDVQLVGTCENLKDPQAPVWSHVIWWSSGSVKADCSGPRLTPLFAYLAKDTPRIYR